MSSIIALVGSPSTGSRTVALAEHGARHVVTGLLLRDKQIDRSPGGVTLGPEVRAAVEAALRELVVASPATAGVLL